jgi:hypothetical protein
LAPFAEGSKEDVGRRSEGGDRDDLLARSIFSLDLLA